VAAWVDDLIFIMSTPEHGECAGFEGGCAVCEEYHGRALAVQDLWRKKAAKLNIPLSAKGHEVSQQGSFTGVGIDTLRGIFFLLPDKLKSMFLQNPLLQTSGRRSGYGSGAGRGCPSTRPRWTQNNIVARLRAPDLTRGHRGRRRRHRGPRAGALEPAGPGRAGRARHPDRTRTKNPAQTIHHRLSCKTGCRTAKLDEPTRNYGTRIARRSSPLAWMDQERLRYAKKNTGRYSRTSRPPAGSQRAAIRRLGTGRAGSGRARTQARASSGAGATQAGRRRGCHDSRRRKAKTGRSSRVK
jgi:hypothetical protein